MFARWDNNTLNTPYKSGQTTSSQGFALCYGELDKLQTAIAWAKGDYNVYVLNGVSGTTSGWKKLALKDDLIKYKEYTTASLNLTADTYNVIADLSGISGQIIGVTIKEIQVPSSGTQSFYANVYAKSNELRAVVSVSQHYLFKVSVFYK